MVPLQQFKFGVWVVGAGEGEAEGSREGAAASHAYELDGGAEGEGRTAVLP